MKRIQALALGLVLGLGGLAGGYAFAQSGPHGEKEKGCCAECCCCKKAEKQCCAKHEKM